MTDLLDAAKTEAPAVAQDVAVVQPGTAPVVTEGPGALLSAIVSMARDPSVDADKLDKLLGQQERLEAREAERRFNIALMNLPAMYVKKNGMIDLTSKDDRAAGRQGKPVAFARWEDMAKLIEPLLAAQGFRLSFDSVSRQNEGGGLVVTGTLLHRDGHSRSASMPLALDTGPGRNNLQAMGSTLSYGKRYTTEMLLNIVREGDDNDGVSLTRKITEPEALELEDMLRRSAADRPRFMKHYGIENILDLTAEQLPHARKAINARLAAQAVTP